MSEKPFIDWYVPLPDLNASFTLLPQHALRFLQQVSRYDIFVPVTAWRHLSYQVLVKCIYLHQVIFRLIDLLRHGTKVYAPRSYLWMLVFLNLFCKWFVILHSNGLGVRCWLLIVEFGVMERRGNCQNSVKDTFMQVTFYRAHLYISYKWFWILQGVISFSLWWRSVLCHVLSFKFLLCFCCLRRQTKTKFMIQTLISGILHLC